VVSREVTFADNGVTLAGTVLLPSTPGRHAAVVFLHGSGPEGRWANRYLAQKFAQNGIAALIYDKRGVGQSSGDWQKVGFAEFADDAVAGIGFVRTLKEVDAAHVGIYGHSQGATMAPLVAVRDGHLGFVIASAAGGIAPADVETYSVENNIGIAQLPAVEQRDAKAYVEALIDVAYRGKSREALDAMAARFKDRPWYFDLPPADNSYWTIARAIADFDPSHWWRAVHAPVLLVYGAHDERVPPTASTDAIRGALAAGGNTHVTVKLYPDADHTFTLVDPARKGGWPLHVQGYADTMAKWVRQQL
jgi:dipeptidyl aminopeptidase/acylaminoacyl peptidase